MRTKTRNKLFNIAFYLNLFCVAVVIGLVGFHWSNEMVKNEAINNGIARAIEVVAPNLLEFLSGGNALQPTDFVNNKTN